MPVPIDLDHLRLYVGDDRALLDEILTIFDEQAESWLARLDPVADDESWRHAAHSLKGASRGVGAWAVGDLAERAETLVGPTANKVSQRADLLRDLRAAVTSAVAFARDVRDRR